MKCSIINPRLPFDPIPGGALLLPAGGGPPSKRQITGRQNYPVKCQACGSPLRLASLSCTQPMKSEPGSPAGGIAVTGTVGAVARFPCQRGIRRGKDPRLFGGLCVCGRLSFQRKGDKSPLPADPPSRPYRGFLHFKGQPDIEWQGKRRQVSHSVANTWKCALAILFQ